MDFRLMTEPEMESWYTDELCSAFAAQECKPLADIRDSIRAGRYEVWGLFEGERLTGYATLWTAPGIPLVLLDYLGVTAVRRGGGLGAHMLSLLKGRGRPIVLESESPIENADETENAWRIRRMGFYRRNGFTPVYRMATCGMAWQAMLFTGDELSTEEVMLWHRALYGPARTDVQIPLPPGDAPKPPYWMR